MSFEMNELFYIRKNNLRIYYLNMEYFGVRANPHMHTKNPLQYKEDFKIYDLFFFVIFLVSIFWTNSFFEKWVNFL